MNNQHLDKFVTSLSNVWGEPSSALTLKSKTLLETLTKYCQQDDWFQQLLLEPSPAQEIYRDNKHGFILMAHVEHKGELSPPHDHGDGWVLYATVSGQVNMGIYHKLTHADGSVSIVQKDAYPLRHGQCSVYLPGDIHDTHTVEDNTVMLRLTSCDFNKEFEQGRLTRYTQNVEKW